MSVIFDETWGTGARQCGGCTLCCKLLPVHHGAAVNGIDLPGSWHKAAGERCRHQRTGKGCAVYRKPGFPTCCAFWNCRWLTGNDTDGLRRPDRSHYCIDIMPDFITLTEGDEKTANVEVVQIWVDPKYPDAHRDPALRAYLARRGKEGIAAIIRYSSSEAFVLFPPAMTSDGEFHERHDGKRERDRTPAEMIKGVEQAQRHRVKV